MSVESVLIELVTADKELLATSGTLIDNLFVLTTSHILPDVLPDCKPGLNPTKGHFEDLEFNIISERYVPKIFKLSAYIRSEDVENSISHLPKWNTDQRLPLDYLFSTIIVLSESQCELSCITSCLQRLGQRDRSQVGDEVTVLCSAFGHRSFVNSLSSGVISNKTGVQGCFILTDCPSVPGCEGGVILNKTGNEKSPVGIVVSSLNWSNGEWLGLTLGITFSALLPHEEKSIGLSNLPAITDAANSSLVRVVSGGLWGTGLLLDKTIGLFATNAHVVENVTSVALRWRLLNFQATVEYTSDPSKDVDLALLKLSASEVLKLQNSGMKNISFCKEGIEKGDRVFAAGFPIFDQNMQPSITGGNVSKIEKDSIITTCTVLPGSSGGAILNRRGHLVGIIVGNAKLCETNAIYPRINYAIKVSVLKGILHKKIQSRGTIQELKKSSCKQILSKL